MRKKRRKLSKKLVLLFIIVLAVFLIYYSGLDILKNVPFLWNVYLFTAFHFSQKTLLGLFLSVMTGSLFFITLPVEIFFFFYLASDHHFLIVIFITILGSTLGLLMDYLIGFVIGKRVINYFMKNSFERFHGWLEKFGGLIILFGNIVPFPIQLTSLVFGGVRYNLKKFVIYTVLGQVVKYSALFFLQEQITDKVLPYVIDLF